MAVIFHRDAQGVWRYNHHHGIHELDVNLTKRMASDSEEWLCEIRLLEKAPSDPCQAPDECDYDEAALIDGMMRPCGSCAEKAWSSTDGSVWGMSAADVVPLAKAELSALHRYQKVLFVEAIVKDRWQFPTS
jgi:hypothetical protein